MWCGRPDNPWYPTMRVFRQDTFQRWGLVFDRIAAELRLLAPRPPVQSESVPVSPGELLDKLTILEIKRARIGDPAKLRSIEAEWALLSEARDRTIASSSELDELVSELRRLNGSLWDVEDALRECDAGGEFGERFVGLARSVYRENDRRAGLKRQINRLLGAAIVEEKPYAGEGLE